MTAKQKKDEWKSQPMTVRQMCYIMHAKKSGYKLPYIDFKTATRGEAHRYIRRYLTQYE